MIQRTVENSKDEALEFKPWPRKSEILRPQIIEFPRRLDPKSDTDCAGTPKQAKMCPQLRIRVPGYHYHFTGYSSVNLVEHWLFVSIS